MLSSKVSVGIEGWFCFFFCLPEGKKQQVVGAVSLAVCTKEGKDTVREVGGIYRKLHPSWWCSLRRVLLWGALLSILCQGIEYRRLRGHLCEFGRGSEQEGTKVLLPLPPTCYALVCPGVCFFCHSTPHVQLGHKKTAFSPAGSEGTVLATPAWGPKFNPLEPMFKSAIMIACTCNPSAGEGWDRILGLTFQKASLNWWSLD